MNAIRGVPECWEVNASAVRVQRVDALDRDLSIYVVEPGNRHFYVEDGGG